MNVGELRAALAEYPDDTLVVVQGYEFGYDDPSVGTTRVFDEAAEVNAGAWWRGRYYDDPDGPLEAVAIRR